MRLRAVGFVDYQLLKGPMEYSVGAVTKTRIQGLQEQREIILFYATDARDLSMVECTSTGISNQRPAASQLFTDWTSCHKTGVRYLQDEEPHHHIRDRNNIRSLDIVLYRRREDSILKFSHQLVGLLRQAERQDGVRQDSSQMGKEPLVDG